MSVCLCVCPCCVCTHAYIWVTKCISEIWGYHSTTGDTVVQNGANSGVGQAVIQLAAHCNINTINIIRNRWSLLFTSVILTHTGHRVDIDEMKEYLIELGATEVITEEQNSKRDVTSLYQVITLTDLINYTHSINYKHLYIHTNGHMITWSLQCDHMISYCIGKILEREKVVNGRPFSSFTDQLHNICDFICEYLPSTYKRHIK